MTESGTAGGGPEVEFVGVDDMGHLKGRKETWLSVGESRLL